MIGVFTIVTTVLQQNLSTQEREQDKQNALLQREQSERQADDLRKETVFATYLNDVSKLLIVENRTQSLIQIRTKTLVSLRQLDSRRKEHLLLFLYENKLISDYRLKPLTSLLRLHDADFNGIFFKGTIEARCLFPRIYLSQVYLSHASFIDCYIDRSTFSDAVMYKANFSNSKLTSSDFSGASLVEADFTGAAWIDSTINLINTNLTGAILSDEQLRNSTIYNSVMPNGSWGFIQTENLVVNGNVERNCTSDGSNFLVGWNITKDAEIKVYTYNTSNFNPTSIGCYFRVISFYTSRKVAYVSQIILLEKFLTIISAGLARYHASADFQCFGTQYAVIELHFIDRLDLQYSGIYSEDRLASGMNSKEMSGIIFSDVRSVRLYITFIDNLASTLPIDQSYCICDNVKFSIAKA